MQPSQSPSDRMLTALVLHVVSTTLGKKNDPLVQPFVAILTNPQALTVSLYIYHATHVNKVLNVLNDINIRCLMSY